MIPAWASFKVHISLSEEESVLNMNLIRVPHLERAADGIKYGNKNMRWDVIFSFLERPSAIDRWFQENKACAEMPVLLCQLLSIISARPFVDRFNSLDQQLQNYPPGSFLCRDELPLPCQPWSGWEGMRCTQADEHGKEIQSCPYPVLPIFSLFSNVLWHLTHYCRYIAIDMENVATWVTVVRAQ